MSSLECQLATYKNEMDLLTSEHEVTLSLKEKEFEEKLEEKDQQIEALKQLMQGMQTVSTDILILSNRSPSNK